MTNKIILAGPSNLIKASLTQIMALHQLTENIEASVQDTQGLVQRNKQSRVKRRYHPKITLVFSEDKYIAASKNRSPIVGEIGFRVMTETHKTMNEAKATVLANRIKLKFAGETVSSWDKGKTMYSYTDWDKGYQLQLLCTGESEARRLIENLLDIQQHSPDWEKLSISSNSVSAQRYPEMRQTEYVYGENREIEQDRPLAKVYFRYAHMHVEGVKGAIGLVDTTNRLNTVLVT
jgi:hypothetical protein